MAKKSSALKRLEERRAATRPPIDASAIVSPRPKPVSRPAGVPVSEEAAREEERDLMRVLISAESKRDPKQATPRKPLVPPTVSPNDTVSPTDTVSDNDPVSSSATGFEAATVSQTNTGVLKDTVSLNHTASLNDADVLNDTVLSGDAGSLSDTVSLDATVSLGDPGAQSDILSASPKSEPNLALLEQVSRPCHTHVGIARLLARYGNVQIRPKGRYTPVLWSIDDTLAQLQTPYEQAVYRQLYRLSYGFGNTHCFVGYDSLLRRCNMQKTALRAAVKGLERKKHIENLLTINEKTLKGTIYRVFRPDEVTAVAGGPDSTPGEETQPTYPPPTPQHTTRSGDTLSPDDTESLSDPVRQPNSVSIDAIEATDPKGIHSTLQPDTISHADTVSPHDAGTPSNTESQHTISLRDTVTQSGTIKIENNAFTNKTPTPAVHRVLPTSLPREQSAGQGENPASGNLALKFYPFPQTQPFTGSRTVAGGELSEIEHAYIYSRPASEQSDIFDAQDAWDEILGRESRPAASKLNEILDLLRELDYRGAILIERFRGCLEKTKPRAKDPVAWLISALKKGRYP